MRLICENGFYKFFPDYVGELLIWENRNGKELFQRNNYWTFEDLAEFPTYSINNFPLIAGLRGETNFEGRPEEVLAKNKLTYNLKKARITSRASVFLQRLDYVKGAYLTFPKLPQAFALDNELKRVASFEGFVDVRLNTYKIERLIHVSESTAGFAENFD